MGHPPLRVAVIALAVAATLGVTGSSRSASSLHASTTAQAVEPTPAAAALEQTFVAVYRAVSPSVVQISTSEGLGSGIIFDKSGSIVTNDHVVGTATAFSVTTSTGRRLKGSLVGRFTPDDLAVIKVNGSGLRPAAFADSSKLRVGDIAMAIGNPLGLSSSVTEGIVSALNRQEAEGNGVTLPNTIQTSAPINPGNSGGALVDIHGRVIGDPDPRRPGSPARRYCSGHRLRNPQQRRYRHRRPDHQERARRQLPSGLPRDHGRRYRRKRRLRRRRHSRWTGVEGRHQRGGRDRLSERHADPDARRPVRRSRPTQAGSVRSGQARPPVRRDRLGQGDARPVPRKLRDELVVDPIGSWSAPRISWHALEWQRWSGCMDVRLPIVGGHGSEERGEANVCDGQPGGAR